MLEFFTDHKHGLAVLVASLDWYRPVLVLWYQCRLQAACRQLSIVESWQVSSVRGYLFPLAVVVASDLWLAIKSRPCGVFASGDHLELDN